MIGSQRVARLRERQQKPNGHAAEALRAAGYTRVSGDEQTRGYGLEIQERAIRAFAASQGYELLEVACDPGVSGATAPAGRAGFGRLMELAAASSINVILVWKFDRLARQIVYAVTTANDLAERYGVSLRSVTEPIDTATTLGKTIFAVLAGMAEQERHSIIERTWGGRRAKAGLGGFAGGATPYGYCRRQGQLTIDAHEAVIVRCVYGLRKNGATLAEIARRLNADGVRTRRGGPWRSSSIAYLLDNPKYRGMTEYLFRWGGTDQHIVREGVHEAIIDAEGESVP